VNTARVEALPEAARRWLKHALQPDATAAGAVLLKMTGRIKVGCCRPPHHRNHHLAADAEARYIARGLLGGRGGHICLPALRFQCTQQQAQPRGRPKGGSCARLWSSVFPRCNCGGLQIRHRTAFRKRKSGRRRWTLRRTLTRDQRDQALTLIAQEGIEATTVACYHAYGVSRNCIAG
jgi:hypothetical protein